MIDDTTNDATLSDAALEFVVSEDDGGARVDVVVARLTNAARSQVTEAAREGRILINGKPAKPSTTLVAADRVSANVAARVAFTVIPQDIPLDILFEDETIIVVNKAAGMVTHPAHGSPDGTLVNALLHHVGHLPGDPVRAGLVHRLDRDTSGLLLIAKTPEALTTLGRAMQKRYITREYLGLVTGSPEDESGTLEGPIARDPRNRMKYAVRSDGKHAITHFTVAERLNGASELRFKLDTGRTHQIRVHMAAYGNAIVNDVVYGRRDRRSTLPGQALHAWRLAFKHPRTKEHMTFEAPLTEAYLSTRALFM
jgi:23S rRNA pseudouridine1911/1915/1917 synthase